MSIVLDVLNGNVFLLVVLDHLLQALVAEFHQNVLDGPLLAVFTVEEVQHLHYIGRSFEFLEDFILSRDYKTSFLSSFKSHQAFSVEIVALEDISESTMANDFLRSE